MVELVNLLPQAAFSDYAFEIDPLQVLVFVLFKREAVVRWFPLVDWNSISVREEIRVYVNVDGDHCSVNMFRQVLCGSYPSHFLCHFCTAWVEWMMRMDYDLIIVIMGYSAKSFENIWSIGVKTASVVVHIFTCSHDIMVRKARAAQGCSGMLTFLELNLHTCPMLHHVCHRAVLQHLVVFIPL